MSNKQQLVRHRERWLALLHALKLYRKALEAEPFTNSDVNEDEKLYFYLLRKNVDNLISEFKSKIERI